MAKQQKMSIEVNELKINLQTINQNEYFSLTDLAKFQSEDSKKIIQNWLRAKSTMSFLAAQSHLTQGALLWRASFCIR